MKKPLAYVACAWNDDCRESRDKAIKYCRQVYEAGFSPICPMLLHSMFLVDTIPQEHKDERDMARDYLQRARVLIVCGDIMDKAMEDDIGYAKQHHITATTLDGILTIQGQGRSVKPCR